MRTLESSQRDVAIGSWRRVAAVTLSGALFMAILPIPTNAQTTAVQADVRIAAAPPASTDVAGPAVRSAATCSGGHIDAVGRRPGGQDDIGGARVGAAAQSGAAHG